MSDLRRSHGFPLSVAVVSDVGRVRENNEDSSGMAWLPDGTLFVMVADGMGGHEAGEVASGLAVRVVEEVVQRDIAGDPRARLYNGLMEANAAILDEGKRSGTRGMGTTAIAGLFRGSEVYVGQVGDSRVYHLRKGRLVWRTSDHTRVQMLVDTGQIDADEARHHPESGMLTRALGHARMADGRQLTPEVTAEPVVLEPEDALVFCSDGLHDLLEDDEIGRIVAGMDAMGAARALVTTACERGGHDNVTVAVVVGGERTSELDPAYLPESWEHSETTLDPEAFQGGGADPTHSIPPLSVPRATIPPAPPREPPAAGGSVALAVFGAAGVAAIGGALVVAALAAAAWWWINAGG